ncbi:putative acetyltransferase C18B11.09c [Yarrowia sp. C11]|nr:putative acetyltransferase C18B11.09c [Yarrowia sp. E02]KAG5369766.1 putative acetyltransferase C18B11.09c [Yarrowia sp. C11]
MGLSRKFELDQEQIAQSKKLNNVLHGPEYDKMISSMGYQDAGPELVQGRHRIRMAQKKYNDFFPEDVGPDELAEKRTEMLEKMLGKVGKGAYIEPPVFFDYGNNMSIGERFYSNYNCTFLDCALITIGDRVLLGPNVNLITATHDVDVQSRRDHVEYAAPITIGDDCWLGSGVQVMPGVNIGKGCTIGANSVVTRDIPAYSVAVGAPARVIKSLEDPDKKE